MRSGRSADALGIAAPADARRCRRRRADCWPPNLRGPMARPERSWRAPPAPRTGEVGRAGDPCGPLWLLLAPLAAFADDLDGGRSRRIADGRADTLGHGVFLWLLLLFFGGCTLGHGSLLRGVLNSIIGAAPGSGP